MALIVLLGRILLAAVFALAGLSKLAAFSSTREGVAEFGVPAAIARPFAVILIAAELAVASSLVPSATAWYGAIGAVALLAIFSVAIAANLARNRRPSCNCFGQLHAAPIGWPTFARNLALLAIAGTLVADPRDTTSSLFAWMRSLRTDELIALAIAVAFLALLAAIAALLLAVLRQQGRLLLRFEVLERYLGITEVAEPPPVGLAPGLPAPAFSLPDLSGETIALEHLLAAKKPALLVFTNPSCGPCQALLPEIARWQRDFRDELAVALVSEGSPEANREKVAQLGVGRVLLQRDREVADAYEAWGTPAAVAVAPDGRVASSLAQGGDAIRQLVRAMRAGELPLLAGAEPPAVAVGEPAPDLTFETLGGEALALSNLRGEPTLLLFWNQACGFCQRMLPELRAWEANANVGAPRVLIVSTSAAAEHGAMNLRSTIVLDAASRAAQAFGAQGTPMGILLDREGRVASDVVAGAQAVLALANRADASSGNGRVTATVG